ncbi:DUF4296 domain-containing protein [Arcicella rigui]|uniref:DUF4296 domain-containing protein n=1 Tax=Arcicella rigui TaxID=797020 RepID=A0ABU5Q8A7_9BACT|nr:DUF4296 domain-containing protein [Arcicella rigui]MEA5138807.1 DUF4296 domain-containing protein [Arcicella rigui]
MRLRILMIASLMMACGSNDKPENLIDKAKMAIVLADVHEAEARVSNMHFANQDTSLMVYKRVRWQVMQKNKVDTAAFRLSLRHYIMHPDEFKNIYLDVKRILEDRRKKLNDVQNSANKKRSLKDSLAHPI